MLVPPFGEESYFSLRTPLCSWSLTLRKRPLFVSRLIQRLRTFNSLRPLAAPRRYSLSCVLRHPALLAALVRRQYAGGRSELRRQHSRGEVRGKPFAASQTLVRGTWSRMPQRRTVLDPDPKYDSVFGLSTHRKVRIETRVPVRLSVEARPSSSGTRYSVPPLELSRQRNVCMPNCPHLLCRFPHADGSGTSHITGKNERRKGLPNRSPVSRGAGIREEKQGTKRNLS